MRFRVCLTLLATGLVGPAASACGACGCSLHTDWGAQGITSGAGFRISLRYDYFDQDQLRLDSGKFDASKLSLPADEEIQQRTLNRTLLTSLDYSPDGRWGLTLTAPFVLRTHDTLGEGEVESSSSRSQGLGDLRIVGRYQGFLADQTLGVQLGVKLPTGATKDLFLTGPLAGTDLDRGLQLGTGTTDLLAGLFKFGYFNQEWGYFAQAMVQVPVASREGYRPGVALNANVGIRYTGFASFMPQLQLNARHEAPDSGPNADAPNSGASLVYLSPGLTYQATGDVQVSAFVQIPLSQRVTGLQLEPRWFGSLGLSYRF